MAPFAGRVRGGRFAWGGQVHELVPNHAGHAMHGTVFDRRWLLELADVGYLRLRTDLQPGWPFPGWVVHEVALSATRLELRLEVHTAGSPFPATLGWHPWFRRRIEVGGALRGRPRRQALVPAGRRRPPARLPRAAAGRSGRGTTASPPITWPVRLTLAGGARGDA